MTKNNYSDVLNKTSLLQLLLLIFGGFISYVIYKATSITSSLLISGITSFLYTQLIKIGIYNKFFGLFGFPIRLILLAPPCAILVHKLHSDLIALFIGFLICQIIYIVNIWQYSKSNIIN